MSIYANTARFDTGRALTEDEMFKLAPSIFATEAHDSRSDRFVAIPTIEIIRGLSRDGFSVVGAKQSTTRIADRKPYTKHLLRIRRLGDAAKYTVGDNVLELLLKNGNDGSAAYSLMAGMFRVVCMNSLVAQTSTVDEVKVRHTGQAVEKVIEGSHEVLKSAERIMSAPQDWSKMNLTERQRYAFAVGVHTERFADAHGAIATNVTVEQLLQPRRQADTGRDLWSTMNVLQENAVRGGIHSVGRNALGQRRRATTREVQGIDQSVKLNKGIWAMAEYLAEHPATERVA